MQPDDKFRVVEGLESEPLEDRLLVYSPEGGQVVELNSPAALIVSLCDGANSVADITRLIADAFPDASAAVAIDVPIVVEQLLLDGILVEA